ncbi:MAG: hypothetical protein ACO1OC_03310 [Tuberibacillus sp.]
MIKDIELVYEKGVAAVNEDAYVVNREELVFTVIDGATGLGKLTGRLAAQTIKEAIENGRSHRLVERVLEGNVELGKRIAEAMGATHIDEVEKPARSVCALAGIKMDTERMRLETVHAADCMIFLQYVDRSVRMLTFDHVSPFDSRSIAIFHEDLIKAAGKSDPNLWNKAERETLIRQSKEKVQPILKQNRSRLNTVGGYSVLDGSAEAQNFLETGEYSLNRVAKILLVSDGLQLPNKKAGGAENWLETADFALRYGLDALKRKIQAMEESDPACFIYPRLKYADDKTGILITL